MKILFRRFCWLACVVAGLAGWQGARAQGSSGSSTALGVEKLPATVTMRESFRSRGLQPTFYLDGRLITHDALTTINPNDIARTVVFKGRMAGFIEPTAAGVGLISITSKQREGRPETKAFDRTVALLECQANAAPDWQPGQPAPAGARFFLNGKAVSRAQLEGLSARRIAKTEILAGKQAADYAHDLTALSVLAVTTR